MADNDDPGVDRARLVRGNFVGNAIQEIAGLAGCLSPLNMAIGQFVNYPSLPDAEVGDTDG